MSLQTSFLQVQAHDWRAHNWEPPPLRPWGPPPPPSYRWHHHHHNNGNDAALVGGLVGFATGMVVGGMIADRPPPPGRVYVYDQQPPIVVYRNPLTPWTDEWRMYCYRKYNSFNEHTGTYIDYNGEEHFCTN